LQNDDALVKDAAIGADTGDDPCFVTLGKKYLERVDFTRGEAFVSKISVS
jgi:hypothetical protein